VSAIKQILRHNKRCHWEKAPVGFGVAFTQPAQWLPLDTVTRLPVTDGQLDVAHSRRKCCLPYFALIGPLHCQVFESGFTRLLAQPYRTYESTQSHGALMATTQTSHAMASHLFSPADGKQSQWRSGC
jgi:hypothetical protein